MDVVYNHLYDAYRCHFSQLVPGYYFRYSDIESRTLADGSGCGNETASERAMMRKFIVESVAFWAEEYHLDGFRFDLMGLHDIATMNAVRSRLDCIDTQIIMTGEGWIMAPPCPMTSGPTSTMLLHCGGLRSSMTVSAMRSREAFLIPSPKDSSAGKTAWNRL